MPFLVRKITLSKWKKSINEFGDDSISADAPTSCLRTTNNTLSFWIAETEQDIRRAAMAILASLDSISSLDYVVLDTGNIEALELAIEATPGDTLLAGADTLHRDLVNLDIQKLKIVSEMIRDTVKDDNHKRISVGEIKKMFKEACDKGDLDLKSLPTSIQDKVA
ncbi:conserved hypothetical protein [Alteromonas macleodii]|nr:MULTISPECIES: hypothetical protein [Alteromonas]HBL19475.1 hypothetical protein [Alteromonas mediterranea]AMN11707.1 hypothetical protein ACZ81_09025 [Alteromonas macleodii]CAI2389871.1 hypothetical protein ALT831_01832 [Alteromonas macleodii]CAI3952132.1 hypothetical protein ALTBGP9_01762 [Alteromonas macleodii]CAI3953062.1 hypothetical protein ALTBGP14_01832 [Alteromonas macleodii]